LREDTQSLNRIIKEIVRVVRAESAVRAGNGPDAM
jgi:hypothetical protein